MTDEPTIKESVVAELINSVRAEKTWLQRHERIVLAALLGLVLVFGIFKIQNILADRADRKAALLQQQLDDQKATNAQLAAQATQTAQQYQAMVDALSKQNAALATAISQRQVVLQQQQEKDKTLPPTELAKRWESLIGGTNADVTPTPSGYSVSPTGAIATVTTLEQVPTLQSNLADETTIANNRQQELNKANGLVTALQNQVGGLQAQITDSDKAHNAEITKIKADARKSKRNWFLRGLATGAAIVTFLVVHGA